MNYLKRNLKIALQSVKFNIKQYLPFFAVLLITQTCFGTMFGVFSHAKKEEQRVIASDYDYHIAYYSVNDAQLVYLERYAKENNRTGFYTIVEELTVSDTYLGGTETDVRIRLLDPVDESFALYKKRIAPMLKSYIEEGGKLKYYYSPLLESGMAAATGFTTLGTVLFSLISLGLMTVLYVIRINNYKFEYGIYMTCGADFRKLSENAIFEMVIVSALTFLPSLVLSAVLGSVICGGFAFMSFGNLCLTLLITTLEAIATVFFPMMVVSKIYPMKNIIAADNSNYVISPRRSFDLIGKKPKDCQIYSVYRFRKYFLTSLAVSGAFAVVSACFYYNNYLSSEKQMNEKPQFTIKFNGGIEYDSEISEQLHDFEGVSFVYKCESTDAALINSHVAVGKGHTAAFAGFVKSEKGSCNDCFDIVALDGEVIEYLERFSYDGDLSQALEEGWCVVADTRYNRQTLKLKPGDSVYVGYVTGYNPESTVTADELIMLKDEALLRAKLEFYTYGYREYKVAAVIHDIPTGFQIPIYFGNGDYLKTAVSRGITSDGITEKSPEIVYENIGIYTDPMSKEELKALEYKIKEWAAVYGSFEVSPTHAEAEKEIGEAIHIPELYRVLGLLTLLSCPIILMYSNLVFYKKRQDEMRMMLFLGGTTGEIKSVYRRDACMTGVISMVLTGVFTFAAVKVIFAIAQRSAGSEICYHFVFPTAMFAAVVLLAFAVSFASVIVCLATLPKSESGLFEQ